MLRAGPASPIRSRCGDIAAAPYIASCTFRKPGALFASLALNWRPLLGNEQRHGRRDLVRHRKIALIQCQPNAPARIHVEEWLTHGHVHEGFDVRNGEGLLAQLDDDSVAEVVAEFLELVAWNIGDERAERVIQADDLSFDALAGRV